MPTGLNYMVFEVYDSIANIDTDTGGETGMRLLIRSLWTFFSSELSRQVVNKQVVVTDR